MAKPQKHVVLQTQTPNLVVGYVWGGAPLKIDNNWLDTYSQCDVLLVVRPKVKDPSSFLVQIFRVDTRSTQYSRLYVLHNEYEAPRTLVEQVILLERVSEEIEALGNEWLWGHYRALHQTTNAYAK